MDDPSFIGFYAAIYSIHLDDVEAILRKYVSRYLITCECSVDSHKATEGWHMHFLIQGTDKDYNAIISKFKTKYKLQGKTVKNAAHAYGRVRGELRSVERYISYMLKDQVPLVTTTCGVVSKLFRFSQFEINFLIDLQNKSYPKDNPNKFRDELMAYIGDIPPYIEFDPDVDYQLLCSSVHPVPYVRERIIQYFQENTDKAPTRSKVQYYMLHYFVQYNKFALTAKQIADWFYA